MRRLQLILKGESTFDDLLRRQRRESMLQERIHRALPPALAKHIAVIDARSADLELIAASGAAAALLRQRAPELRAALAREGFEFTGIRVRAGASPSGTQASTKILCKTAGYRCSRHDCVARGKPRGLALGAGASKACGQGTRRRAGRRCCARAAGDDVRGLDLRQSRPDDRRRKRRGWQAVGRRCT